MALAVVRRGNPSILHIANQARDQIGVKQRDLALIFTQ